MFIHDGLVSTARTYTHDECGAMFERAYNQTNKEVKYKHTFWKQAPKFVGPMKLIPMNMTFFMVTKET